MTNRGVSLGWKNGYDTYGIARIGKVAGWAEAINTGSWLRAVVGEPWMRTA